MDEIALDPLFTQCFDLAKLMYFYMPLNPYRKFLGNISNREYWTGLCVYYFVLFSQLLLSLLYVMHIMESRDGDFLRTSTSYVWLILAINSFLITWNIFRYNAAVGDLIRDLYTTFPKTQEEQADLDVDKSTTDWANKMLALRNIFLLSVLGMTMFPFLRSVAVFIWNGSWKPEMPLTIWLPFDPKPMPVYPFAYAAEIWLFFVNSCIMLAFEATMGGVITLICLQFKKVQFHFRSIKFGEYNADLTALIEGIKLHNRTLKLSVKAREVFSIFLFINFLLSSMVICVFTFLLFTERDPLILFQYTTNLTGFSLYIASYGYFGDQLFDYSANVADAIYDSNWLDADIRIRKMIIRIIQRANEPQTLTGLGFFFASIPTLSKILTTSYSYFALLMSVYKTKF